jgi:AcrR family transcriptional regulator
LYYYFADKADLFKAVVDSAHEERYRLMQAAAENRQTVREKLEQILADIFEYALKNQELMRLTFATAFATSSDAPAQCQCHQKGRRNFEFVRSLIEAGQASGELSSNFTSEELAMGIYGQLNSYVMIRLLVPDCPLNRKTALQIVRLFLKGATHAPAAVKSQVGMHPVGEAPLGSPGPF